MADSVQTLIPNISSDLSAGKTFLFGPFRLEVARRLLTKDGRALHVGGRALDVLLALVEQAGTVVSKNELLSKVWPDARVDEGSLRVQVANLRKELGDGQAGARYLTTVPGRGYCFTAPVSISSGRTLSPASPSEERAHNLPTRLTRMIGRDQAVHEISERVLIDRFVTIAGPGGIGKTAVAISTGRALLNDFDGAVYFIDLGSVRDPGLVLSALASVLGLLGQSGDPTPALISFLRNKRMLLLLDSCEHVIDTSASLAERIYKEAPHVHILATSQESLRVEGEHIHFLPPLASPPEDAGLTAKQALTFPAVQLFVERATANNQQFALKDDVAPVVGEICRKLDGIALAIELAAGRANAYGAREIMALLSDRFMLWEGRRTAPPRHQTLRATLDWSYNLLSDHEQRILCRLSIFVGTFTFEAARSIAAGNEFDDAQMVATLTNLVAKSILTVSTGNASTRYRLLDATRSYVGEKLAAAGDMNATAQRHASYFLNMLKTLGGGSAPSYQGNYAPIADQLGNVRAALSWCFSEPGDTTTGIALAAASMPLFFELSSLAECQHWAAYALEALGEQNTREELDLRAALGLARMFTTGNTADVGQSLMKALAIAEHIGDLHGQVQLCERVHLFHVRIGNFSEALSFAKRGEAAASILGHPLRMAHIQTALGISYHLAGDGALARSHLEAALLGLPKPQPASLPHLSFDYLSRARITLARVLWLQGYPVQAVTLARQALSDAIRINHPVKLSMTLLWALQVFLWNSELETAEECIDRFVIEADKHSLGPYQVIGQGAKGELMVRQGEVEAGIIRLRSSLETMAKYRYGALTAFSTALAEGLARTGQQEEALRTIDEAIALVERNQDLFGMPDLLRVKAEILISGQGSDLIQAERYLRDSLKMASCQSSLSWELRSATALATLWMRQGRHAEARHTLSPIYARFTEGFDCSDLKAARELLSELSTH